MEFTEVLLENCTTGVITEIWAQVGDEIEVCFQDENGNTIFETEKIAEILH